MIAAINGSACVAPFVGAELWVVHMVERHVKDKRNACRGGFFDKIAGSVHVALCLKQQDIVRHSVITTAALLITISKTEHIIFGVYQSVQARRLLDNLAAVFGSPI
jgi:hypothetical protein